MTAAVPPDGTVVRIRPGAFPGVQEGARAVVRDESPAGLSNLKSGLVWLQLDTPAVWGAGVSRIEYAGFWAAHGDYDVDQVDQRWPGMPDPHRHNPFAVAAVVGLAWLVVAGAVVFMIATVGR